MDERQLQKLLQEFQQGRLSEQELIAALKALPYEDLSFAAVDHHRNLRQGFPEVIFGQQKTPEQLLSLIDALLERHHRFLATRVAPEAADAVLARHPSIVYNSAARTLRSGNRESFLPLNVAVVCAGTSDLPVAEEAREALAVLRISAEPLYDVGVAGLHRLGPHIQKLQAADGIIVVAGMDGALPGVIGGLVGCPVVAVPTSVGYGASFGGLAALLSMLNCCAAGVTVTNIDNGFGAAFALARWLYALENYRRRMENQNSRDNDGTEESDHHGRSRTRFS